MISSIRDFLGVPPPTKINQIPKEVLLHVFEYLPTKDLNAVVLTNKHFLSAARYGVDNGHLPDPKGKWVRMLMQVQQIRERAFRCRARGNCVHDSRCWYIMIPFTISGVAACASLITAISGRILQCNGKLKLAYRCCDTAFILDAFVAAPSLTITGLSALTDCIRSCCCRSCSYGVCCDRISRNLQNEADELEDQVPREIRMMDLV